MYLYMYVLKHGKLVFCVRGGLGRGVQETIGLLIQYELQKQI